MTHYRTTEALCTAYRRPQLRHATCCLVTGPMNWCNNKRNWCGLCKLRSYLGRHCKICKCFNHISSGILKASGFTTLSGFQNLMRPSIYCCSDVWYGYIIHCQMRVGIAGKRSKETQTQFAQDIHYKSAFINCQQTFYWRMKFCQPD